MYEAALAWELRWTRTLKTSFVDIERMPLRLLFDLERLQHAPEPKAWIEEVI
ncbi:MAG: hypothetical protein IJ668_00025 [Selenomonadaceae bacterium]|nr:hypothetical protein [Selenomonadaceae bacterium]